MWKTTTKGFNVTRNRETPVRPWRKQNYHYFNVKLQFVRNRKIRDNKNNSNNIIIPEIHY